MYDQMGRGATGNLFEATEEENLVQIPVDITGQGTENDVPEDSQRDKEETISSPNPDLTKVPEDIPEGLGQDESRSPGSIVQVMVFYDDDTFRTYKPSK
jgi:hypothetical protein